MGTGELSSDGGDGQERRLAEPVLVVLRCAAIIVVGGLAAWQARDGRRLLRGCAVVTLFAVLAGSQQFAPWYAAPPIALLAHRGSLSIVLLLTACSLALLPLDAMSAQGTVSYEEAAWASRLARAMPLVVGFGFWPGDNVRPLVSTHTSNALSHRAAS